MSPTDILAELEHLGKAGLAHLGGNRLRGHARAFRPRVEKAIDQHRHRIARWQRHIDPQLEAPPHRSVEQLGMVSGSDHDYIARQLVELHE